MNVYRVCVKPFSRVSAHPAATLAGTRSRYPHHYHGRSAPLNGFLRARARAGAGKADSHNYCGAPGGRPSQRTLRVNLALTIAPQHSDWGTHPSGDTAVSGSTGAPSSRPFSEIRGLPLPVARSRGLTRTVLRVHWGVDYRLYWVDRPAAHAALRRVDTPIKMSLRAVTHI